MNKTTNEEIIVINNIQQLKQILKDKSYNNFVLIVVDNRIMVKGIKCYKPEPKAPEWFSSWVKNQYEKDIQHQKQFNKQVLDRIDNVDTRLDTVDRRLNNIVKLNKLKE